MGLVSGLLQGTLFSKPGYSLFSCFGQEALTANRHEDRVHLVNTRLSDSSRRLPGFQSRPLCPLQWTCTWYHKQFSKHGLLGLAPMRRIKGRIPTSMRLREERRQAGRFAKMVSYDRRVSPSPSTAVSTTGILVRRNAPLWGTVSRKIFGLLLEEDGTIGLSPKHIAKTIGLMKSTVGRVLKRWVKEGRIDRIRRGLYGFSWKTKVRLAVGDTLLDYGVVWDLLMVHKVVLECWVEREYRRLFELLDGCEGLRWVEARNVGHYEFRTRRLGNLVLLFENGRVQYVVKGRALNPWLLRFYALDLLITLRELT